MQNNTYGVLVGDFQGMSVQNVRASVPSSFLSMTFVGVRDVQKNLRCGFRLHPRVAVSAAPGLFQFLLSPGGSKLLSS